MITPRGLGVFCRRDVYAMRGAELAKRADRALAARVRWVCLMLDAVDGYRVDPKKLEFVAQAYRERANAQVYVWSFPGDDAMLNVTEQVEWVSGLADKVSAAGVILDLEAPCKFKPLETSRLVAGVRLRNGTKRGLGITSYPLRSMHPSMPWASMGAGFGMPQLYTTAATRKLASRALAEWGANDRPVVPVLAAYDYAKLGGDEGMRLRGDLQRVCLDDDGNPRVQAAAIWSEPQLDEGERQALDWWARRVSW